MNKRYSLGDFLIEALILFRIAVTIMPAVGYYTNSIINIGTFLLIYILLLFRLGLDVFLNKIITFIPVFVISFFVLVVSFVKGESILGGVYEIFIGVLWPLILVFLCRHNDSNMTKRILIYVLLCYLITSITTSIGCNIYEGAARHMSNGRFAETNPDLMALYTAFNIGTFSFIYSVVILFPLILYILKAHVTNIFVSISIIVVFSAVIVITEYTTALLLFMSSFILLLLPKGFKKEQLFGLVSVLLFVLVLFAPILPAIMGFISEMMGSEQVAERLGSISDLWTQRQVDSDSDFSYRIELWSQSLNIFLTSFPIGSGDKSGGHSFVFDNMARYGVLGLLATIFVFRQFYKRFIKWFSSSDVYGYALYAFILNLIECVVNPGNEYFAFTFVIPLFCFYFSRRESNLDSVLKASI